MGKDSVEIVRTSPLFIDVKRTEEWICKELGSLWEILSNVNAQNVKATRTSSFSSLGLPFHTREQNPLSRSPCGRLPRPLETDFFHKYFSYVREQRTNCREMCVGVHGLGFMY